MSSNHNPRYENLSLSPMAAAGLRRLTAELTAAMGRRVTHSETLAALLKLAGEHPERIPRALAKHAKPRPTT